MSTKRTPYSAQFKIQLALEAPKGLKTINELASEHGVHPTQISVVGQFYVNSSGSASWIEHPLKVNFKLTHYPAVQALDEGLTRYFQFYNHERPH